MVQATDIMFYASQKGILLDYKLVTEALASVDTASIEKEERTHWSAVVWDGKEEPPIGTKDRWIHDKDGLGKSTMSAFENGHVVYFLLHDDKLHHYQAKRAYDRGYIYLRKDASHADHWEKAANEHIAIEVEQAVDQKVTKLALEKTMQLHSEKGIPMQVSAFVQRGGN